MRCSADVRQDALIGQFSRIGVRVDADQIRQVAGGDPGLDIFFDRIADHELHVHAYVWIGLAESAAI